MKKHSFKITAGLKGLVAAIAFMGALAFSPAKAANVTMAFAPFALVAGMKKKGFTLDDEQEKVMKGMEDELNASYAAMATEVRKGLMTPEDFATKFNEAKEEILKGVNAQTVLVGTGDAAKSIQAIMEDQGMAIKALQEGGNTATKHVPLAKRISDLVVEVKTRKEQAGDSPFSVSTDKSFDSDRLDANKVAVTMTNSNTQANADGVTVPANYMYGVEGMAAPDVRVDPYIQQFVDNGSTNLAAFPYADKLPTEGTMAITAEGALKPLVSVSIERRFSTAFKIAGRSKLTEEALDDVPGIEALVNGELKFSHDIAEQAAVYTHVAAFAPAFVAGDLAATTTYPSNYDAVRAAIYAIKIASKGKYLPNAIVIHSADAYAMGATKEEVSGQYIMPTFVLPDGTKVVGVRVVETQDDTNVPAGTFIVGDWRKIKRRVYKPFNLRIGQGIVGSATASLIVSDFESNMYTIIGESRLHLWHHKNDEVAFIKTTFAAVKAAIDATV